MKKYNIHDLQTITDELKLKNKKIVMVNGCFDIFHIGHLQLIKFAKSLGDVLLVAINSDNSISRIKQSNRPVFDQKDRTEIIESIVYVDYVIVFDEDTPSKIIQAIKPNVIVKEAEYRSKPIPEIYEIHKNSVELVYFERKRNVSSTNLIEYVKCTDKM